MPLLPSTLTIKQWNYLHMATHAHGEFQHSNSSYNLRLILISKQMGLNLLWTFQVVQGLFARDHDLPSHSLIANLCLVQKLNMPRTSSQPLLQTITHQHVCCSWVMSNSKFNLDQHLDSQPSLPQTPSWWLELGPQLNESSNLKVCLEGHVTYLTTLAMMVIKNHIIIYLNSFWCMQKS